MDQLQREVIQYCTQILDLNHDKLNESELDAVALILGQINLMKIAFLRYLDEYSARILASRIKFLESIKSLISELPLFAYLIEGITLEEYEEVESVFNPSSKKFSFFANELNKSVYSFDHIDELKSLNVQYKIDPDFIKELVVITKNEVKKILLMTIENSKEEFPMLQRFIQLFDHLQLEFYFLIKSKAYNAYDIKRIVPQTIDTIIQKLLRIAKYVEIFKNEEKNQLFLELNKL